MLRLRNLNGLYLLDSDDVFNYNYQIVFGFEVYFFYMFVCFLRWNWKWVGWCSEQEIGAFGTGSVWV